MYLGRLKVGRERAVPPESPTTTVWQCWLLRVRQPVKGMGDCDSAPTLSTPGKVKRWEYSGPPRQSQGAAKFASGWAQPARGSSGTPESPGEMGKGKGRDGL
ncbi:UNVERIFIED_CONTAM: hypothetical protein PYX00_002870 [Menopon gallinae]|uniref:Uncharacterized protein n=1 Tax=Menopon gallinae TaxID=328185 RepID=A0AAW2HY33_9NEOP